MMVLPDSRFVCATSRIRPRLRVSCHPLLLSVVEVSLDQVSRLRRMSKSLGWMGVAILGGPLSKFANFLGSNNRSQVMLYWANTSRSGETLTELVCGFQSLLWFP